MRGLYQRGGVYYVRIPTGEKNKYDRPSLHTRDEEDAKRKAASMLAAYNAGSDIHCLWQDLADRFRKEHFPVLKPGTRETYKWAIVAISGTLYDKMVRDIDSTLIDKFVKARLDGGISSAGVRSELAVLSSIMSKAEGWNLIDRNPVQRYLKANALKVRRGEPRVRWMTRGEEEIVLGLIEVYITNSRRDSSGRLTLKRAIMVAIDTGLRLAELRQLRWTDIAFEREQLHVRKEIAKSKKDRWIPIKWRTLSLLKEMQEQSDSRWVFPASGGLGPRVNFDKTLRYFVTGPAEAAGVAPFSWHDLRRTCGCRLLQDDGLSMEQVSKWLGHASISVTERHYAFLTVDNLHKALEKGRSV